MNNQPHANDLNFDLLQIINNLSNDSDTAQLSENLGLVIVRKLR